MKVFNGERLKKARQYNGLTISELADMVGVTKQMISQYENGHAPTEKVFLFSKNLGFPFEYFMAENNANAITGPPFFRALLRTSKKYKIQQTEKIEHLMELFYALEEYVDFPELNLPDRNNFDTIEDAAMQLREYWGLGAEPVENLVRICEKNGILVTQFQTGTDDIDAYSRSFNSVGQERYVIALSDNKNTAARVHFDIGHELGHILLHHNYKDIEELTRPEFKEMEQEAHSFASEFLLPKSTFLYDIGNRANDLDYYIQMKKKWRISISAMMYRSRTLNLITTNQYQYMMRVMTSKGWRTKEPLDDTLKTADPSLFSDSINLLLGEFDSPQSLVKDISQSIPLTYEQIENLLGLRKGILKPISLPTDGKIVQLKGTAKGSESG